MISTPRMLLVGVCLGVLAGAAPAAAQPPDDSNIKFDAPGFLVKKPKPGLPDVKTQALAWPRLDPGAVLCRTETDLEKLGARRRGDVVDGPVDCRIVRTPTAISIVQRKGPGSVEVKVPDSGAGDATGWTNAWLPDKGAVGAASASR